VRKDLGAPVIAAISRHLHNSIEYSLRHRDDALNHAMRFARGLDRSRADTFVGMYVNEWTRDYGQQGRLAVRTLLEHGAERGIIPHPVNVEFAGDPGTA
jgi:1,4-dihydroxy-6-naphthoate synthase